MAADVDICSDALVLLGEDPIVSLDDTSDRATVCKQLYPRVRDALLVEFPWKFATARASLAQSSVIPVFGWSFQYPLPSDFLRLVEFSGDDQSWINGEAGWGDIFTIEGRLLLTDSSTAFVRYIQKITDTSLFSPGFVSALSARMAWEIAQPITSNGPIIQMAKAAYDLKLRAAQQVDGQEQTPPNLSTDSLIRVR